MKYREIFKLYNTEDIRRNKFPILCIAISLFLTMLVSLVIPQIQIGKEQYINDSKINLNTADLMVSISYPSESFNDKITTLEDEGIKITQVESTPSYLKKDNNQIMVYLLAGYDNLNDNDVIVSKNFANMNDITVGDEIKLSNLNTPIKVTAIEQFPIEVTLDAEVAGYVKLSSTSTLQATGGNHLLFLSGENGETLKEELGKVEEGYKYYTYQERQEQLYGTIDKEIGALSLISAVCFISAIGVLVSGVIMLIIKSKKDIASLMLISIKQKDIIKAIKMEVNWIIFIPLALAVVLCVPVSMILIKFQGITLSLSLDTILRIIIIIIFNSILFILYRNLALLIIKKFDPILIEKGEVGIRKFKIYEKVLYLIPFPICMFIYSAILQSNTSVSVNIFLSLAVIILFFVLWGVISLITILPFWKHWTSTIYSFQSLRFNKMIFVIGALNLTLLICFMFIGFNLSSSLKSSINDNLVNNIPYNYMIRSIDEEQLETSLNNSSSLSGYTKLNYLETKIEKDNIKDKSILLMNRKSDNINSKFKIVSGDDLLENDEKKVLVSEKYANAYDIKLGTKLSIYDQDKVVEYEVKGIYDSGGINVNWIIKDSNDSYESSIYLVKYNIGESPNNLNDCYISSTEIIGDYSLSQANSFLESFRLLSFIFILSTIIFNINVVYMGQQLIRKDFAIMAALGIGNKVIKQQMWIKAITTVFISLIASIMLYTLIMNIMIQVIAKGSATIDILTLAITTFISIVVICIGYLISMNITKNYIDEIKEY